MAEKKTDAQKERDFLDVIIKDHNRGLDADKHNREAAIDDLKFSNPADPQQWNQGAVRDRKADGRPYLTINLFPQYIAQITGDIRHNRPRAQIHPDDSAADIHIARIREGIISDSEYQSNSDYIYVEAGTMMATCGYGAWRVKTRYTEENPFIQEMYDELIENPFTVIMDPNAKDPIYADAEWAFIRTKMLKADFEKEYPNAEVPGDQIKPGPGLTYEHWWDKDTVTVAEYFVKKTEKKAMVQMVDGTVMAEEDAKELITKYQEKLKELITAGVSTPAPAPPSGQLTPPPQSSPPAGVGPAQAQPTGPGMAPGAPAAPAPNPAVMMKAALDKLGPEPKIAKRRDADITKIKHYKFTAAGVLSKNGLEGEDFPGKYIPIVMITGNRSNVEGKRYISGVVRNAKDPARNVNYWYTSAAERIALEPKAPWIGTAKQFEGYEEDYMNANVKNFAMLKYNPDDSTGQLAPPPQRMGPGQVPSALFTQLQTSVSLFESSIGMGKTDMGGEGPERTGAAITARQKPGDIRTFSYIDNLARGIRHGARIKNEIIPELYDTKRDVRLRAIDQTEAYVPINTTAKDAYDMIRRNPDRYKGMNTTKLIAAIQRNGPDAKFNDISAGRYSVKVTVGPSYATQRAESAETMLRLVSSMPKTMGVAADIIVKNMDIKDADILAERLKKLLPPGMAKQMPGEEPPPPPPPPPPQVQLVMSKAKTEEIKQQKELIKAKVEMLRLYKETKESEKEIRSEILNVLAELHKPEMMPQHNTPPQGGMEG